MLPNRFPLILLLVFLPGLAAVTAQKPFFRAFPLPEEYRHVQIRELLLASSGYIWLGASDGLFSFDGKVARPVDVSSFPAPFSVTSLYEDKKGALRVGLESGAILFMDLAGALHPWEPEEGLPSAPVVAMAEDPDGNFWFATYGEGLYCRKGARVFNFSVEDGMGGDEIYDMGVDARGQVWCGTDRGINVVQWKEGKKSVKSLGREQGLPDEIVRLILPDKDCGIWVGMHDGGLCRIDPVTARVDLTVPDWRLGVVTSLACFHEKEIWIGTEGNGLYRFDLPSGVLEALSTSNGRPGKKIHAMLRDTEGGVWISGNASGLFSANRQFEHLDHAPSDIQAVLAGTRGEVWIGARQGLFLKPPHDDIFTPVLPGLNLNVVSLYRDIFDNIWIGTYGDGVYCYQPRNGKMRHLREGPLLENGSVLSIDGRQNKVWLATLGGVNELSLDGDPVEGGGIRSRSYNQESGLSSNYIYRIMVDSRGRTWFCSDGRGLSVLEGETITTFDSAGGIPLKSVYSIAEDGAGRIWFSTSDKGLFRFDGEKFSAITMKEGLRNLSIAGLAGTADGQLLIVHRSGIDLLDPQTGHLIYYDQEVGIPDAEPNLNTIHADGKGNVWIGMPDRLIRFTTLGRPLRIHPETRLEKVSVLLEPVNWWERNEFGYRENFLVFDFVGIWLTDPESVTYRYQLEGHDRDWIYSGDRRVTYSHLSPGQYTFRLASSENGAWADEPILEYGFTIKAPLWQRPWFIFLAVAALAGLVYYLAKNREARLQRIEKLKRDTIQSQYEALKSQINPHFLFNSFNTLLAFIEENPAMAAEYVEKLSDFYRVILVFREKEKITLAEELRLTENFGYLLKKRFGENFSLEIKVEPGQFCVAPLALQMLVENAVKHNVVGRNRPLHVRIETAPDDYLLVANNLQPKLTADPSTGFGLTGIINRYAMLTSRPVIVKETETEFRVLLPLLK